MLKIRLRRMGSRHRPFYRLVVSDGRLVPTASSLDELGTYDPRQSAGGLRLDLARIEGWIRKGAQPSATVGRLIGKAKSEAAAAAAAAETTAAETAAAESKKARRSKKAEPVSTDAAPADAGASA